MYVRQFTTDARAREKPCVRCGLSLRKHLDDRYCPQCGLSVWMTLNGNDSLDYSHAAWLRKAGRGAWAMAAIQCVAMAAYLVILTAIASSTIEAINNPPARATRKHATTTHALAKHDGRPADVETLLTTPVDRTMPLGNAAADESEWEDAADLALPPAHPLPTAIATGLIGVYFVLEAGGLLLLTTNEKRYPDRMKSVRVAARVVAGLSVVLGIGLLALSAAKFAGRGPGDVLDWLILLAVEVMFAVCASVSWFWLRPIARRGGRSTLARLCGYLLFLPVLPFLKAAPFIGLWMFYLISPLLHFVPLVYIPLSIYLFARCGWLLQKAIPHAEEAWSAETKQTADVS